MTDEEDQSALEVQNGDGEDPESHEKPNHVTTDAQAEADAILSRLKTRDSVWSRR